MLHRLQFSPYHIFAPNDLHVGCGRCGKKWSHPDHITRDEDKAETMRWRDRVIADRTRG